MFHFWLQQCYLFVLVAWLVHFTWIKVLNTYCIVRLHITCIHSLYTKLLGNTTLNRDSWLRSLNTTYLLVWVFYILVCYHILSFIIISIIIITIITIYYSFFYYSYRFQVKILTLRPIPRVYSTSWSPNHLERIDKRPFPGETGMKHANFSGAVAHQSSLVKCSPCTSVSSTSIETFAHEIRIFWKNVIHVLIVSNSF